MFPLARTEKLTARELPNETVVYDLAAGKVHCLNPVARLVWKHCDGRTSRERLEAVVATNFGADAAAGVELALEQLSRRGLLQQPVVVATPERRATRRAALARLVAFAALPAVVTLAAPSAAHAESVQEANQKAIDDLNCQNSASALNIAACVNQANGAPCSFSFCSDGTLQTFNGSKACNNGVCA